METIVLKKDKDCKHSVRFAAEDAKAAIETVYIKREKAAKWKEVVITVEGK